MGRAAYLLQQYIDKRITEDELAELSGLLQDEKAGEDMQQAMEGLIEAELVRMQPRPRIPVRRIVWAAAAAVLLFLVVGLWPRHREEMRVASVVHDAAPGGNKAMLTLGDGSRLALDQVKEGVVGRQGNARLIKGRDAQLQYKVEDGDNAVQYNILETPRGGQYAVVLPDGTTVWLNAATALRYPTAFTGDMRVVELRGEAYFEVAPNPSMPFRVKVIKEGEREPMAVDVLGTHFNIMSYGDEPVVKTTLLEGSVRVKKNDRGVMLRPGEQARLEKDGSLVVVKANTDEAVAWKNGLFDFNEADIDQVMRQLSRWYDLQVVYTHGMPTDKFQGEMYRNVNVSKILKILEASGVHFTVEGRKLLVE